MLINAKGFYFSFMKIFFFLFWETNFLSFGKTHSLKKFKRGNLGFLFFVYFLNIFSLLSLYIFERNFSGSDFKASVSSSLAESTLFNDHDGKTPA
ncbi:MAG: hypothetical protein CM15mP22_4700 [Gammaproteobacteria bacterium]|nr:MAG: hypothetical protein CM15mP22_4700 [Gammaproteobacteria bacterium]